MSNLVAFWIFKTFLNFLASKEEENKLLELALKVESQPVETEPLSRTDALDNKEARKEAMDK